GPQRTERWTRGISPRVTVVGYGGCDHRFPVAPATTLSLPQSRRGVTGDKLAAGSERRTVVSNWLPREIEAQRQALHRVLRPIAEAGGLPNETYTSAAFAAAERDAVLAKTWTC